MMKLELQQTAFEGLRMCRDLRLRVDSVEEDASSDSMRRVFGVLEVSLLRLLAENSNLGTAHSAEDSSSSPKKKVMGFSSTIENS